MTEKIPSNDEIIAMIPSKTMREYLTKINWQFSERDRGILRRYLAPKNKMEFWTVDRKDSYITLPHPFRRNDIVLVYDEPLFRKNKKEKSFSLGIVWGPKNDEEFWKFEERARTKLKDSVDFSDVSTTVVFLREDGLFDHGHPNPLQIEYPELDPESCEAKLLECAVKLQKGEGTLEETDYFRQKYIKIVEKKHMESLNFFRRTLKKLLLWLMYRVEG